MTNPTVKLDKGISLLQNNLLKLEEWQNTWLIKFNLTKCITMTLASRIPMPNLYTFYGQQVTFVQSFCYIGVHISNTINWTAQCHSVKQVRKAQQTIEVIRINQNRFPTHIKYVAYKTLVRPIFEYASASCQLVRVQIGSLVRSAVHVLMTFPLGVLSVR